MGVFGISFRARSSQLVLAETSFHQPQKSQPYQATYKSQSGSKRQRLSYTPEESAAMVKNSSEGASASETNAINLTRMVARLQHILVTPDSATESRLRTNRYEREKVGTVCIYHFPTLELDS
jgi:hypothetical protein